MNDELIWDNGTPFPEPCVDRIADTVGKVCSCFAHFWAFSSFFNLGCGIEERINMFIRCIRNELDDLKFHSFFQYEALAWLCGGLSFFASLGLLAVWNDKASTIPFVS